jgi:hypothetical protein
VAVSSRVGEGRIVRGNNWYEPGMVAADNLSPQKAALLLTLALTKTTNVDEIQRMFDEYLTRRDPGSSAAGVRAHTSGSCLLRAVSDRNTTLAPNDAKGQEPDFMPAKKAYGLPAI